MSDPIVFNVNLSKKRAATKTINECIYCDDPEGVLSREHVIPAGLGGGLILRHASCERCRRVTQDFETRCLRGMLLPYRYGFGLVRRLDEMPLFASLRGKDSEPLEIPFSATPRHLLLPQPTEQAKLLEGDGFRPILAYRLRLFASSSDLANTLQRTGESFGLDIPFDLHSYLRMIAKIAHGLAIFDLGLDGFTPMLRDFILGKEQHSVPYHFGWQEWEPPSFNRQKLTHQIGWRVTQTHRAEYIVCQVRLFATHETPPISVVVGTTTLSDAEILHRARPAAHLAQEIS